MIFTLAAGPKMLLNDKYSAILTLAEDASLLLSIFPVIGGMSDAIHETISVVNKDQYAKLNEYHDYNYNLVIMPDYEGYGITRDRAHPYLYQELTARQCIDATRYGIALYNSDPKLDYIRVPIRKEFRTVSCGYSQGGSVAMACQRFVEQNNLTDELHFAGSICGDGPYDPIATLMYYVGQEKRGKYLSMPVVLPLIVKGMLDTNPFMMTHKAEDYFNPKFLEIGIMQWLNDKERSTTDIEDEFERLYEEGKDGDVTYYRDIFVRTKITVRDEDDNLTQKTSYQAKLSAVMNTECYNYFSALYDQYKDSFTEAAGIPLPTQRGVMEDLHLALASNDMTSGWTPLHHLILFHSKGDTVVPYVNAEKAKNSLGSNLELETAINGLDHSDSGTDFFKGNNTFDVGIMRMLSLRIYDYIDNMCQRSYKPYAEKTVEGYVMLNGKPIPAEYTLLDDGTVALGSGHNAAIPQFSSGRVAVPKTVTIVETTKGKEPSSKDYTVSQIMPMAFRLCNNVRFVRVPEGVTRIGEFAFVGCSGLRELHLPSTLQRLASGSLIGLNSLNYIACGAPTPPTWEYNDVFFFHEKGIGDNAAYHFPPEVKLAVPAASTEAYRQADFSDNAIGWTTPDGWGKTFPTIEGGMSERFSIYEANDLMDLYEVFENGEEVKIVSLEADIDMQGKDYKPIAPHSSDPFTATVNGQGHTISNISSLHENNTAGGLFGFYAGPAITNLRLDYCTFYASEAVGAIAGVVDDCRIDSVKVSRITLKGDGPLGGLVGQVNKHLGVDRAAVDDAMFHSRTANFSPVMGGLVGNATDADITNCAVIAQSAAQNKMSPFVGSGKASVSLAYANSSDVKGYVPPAGITHSESVILTGQPLSILDYAGNKKDFTYDTPYFQAVYPAAILGTEAWAYVMGRYAMPDCLADDWTPQPNYATYGSPGLAATHINTLTPDGAFPAQAWLDLSDQGFRHYRFKASRLWIDDNLNVEYNFNHLPIGFAEQITATGGIRLDRALKANDKGMVDIVEPVYAKDADDNLVIGDDGQPVCVDHVVIGERQEWGPKGYAFSLPYNVALPDNCALYQPTRIYDVDGQTTALMERVRENYVEAFRPYYLVVNTDSVTLGTYTEAVSPRLSSAITQLGDYEFVANISQMGYATARQKNVYLLEDDKQWLIATQSASQEGVLPFTSYFSPVTTTPATRIVMTLEDDNPVISVGDYYFTINTTASTPSATLVGYHGRGGNTVVPPSVPYVVGGLERQVPVTEVAPAAFTKSTAQVWSIDMSQCDGLKPLTIDRSAQDNPFYRVDPRTIIYLPEGSVADDPASSENLKNVVVGKECNSLTITDGWDFCPPYDFHADEAEYDRIFYASKQKDGSYKKYAYTVCVPFSMSSAEIDEALDYGKEGINMAEFHVMHYISEKDKTFTFWDYPPALGDGIKAGKPYIINMVSGEFQIKAHDTQLIAEPADDDNTIFLIDSDPSLPSTSIGEWHGTFKRISNEVAGNLDIYTLNGGKWCRIRNDEARYRNAWVGAFRGFFLPFNEMMYNTYAMFYTWEPQGPEDFIYEPFDASIFAVDSDFNGYDDEDVGIHDVKDTPHTHGVADGSWYTLDGRKLDRQPTAKGLYIVNGKIMIIK